MPLRNSTSDQDGEGPCRLVACPLSACSCMCTGPGSKSIAGGPQASTLWLPAVLGPAIILAPFSAGQATGPPSSELRDRLRATPPTVNQFHATTFSLQHLTIDSERPSLDSPSYISVDFQIHKHNHDGTWRRKSRWRRTPCAAPAHQLYFQASPATLCCPDLAVRAGASSQIVWELLQLEPLFHIWCIVLIDAVFPQLAIRIEGKIRGFDEFMNLVIDDAVEVKQITKTNDKEERKNLGAQLLPFFSAAELNRANPVHRPNPVERRQRVFDPELVRLKRGTY